MLNRVILQGRMAEAPELKHSQTGKAVSDFSIAVEDSRITNGERKTFFFKIKAWASAAEFVCKYFEKGQPIIVEGRLETNTYTDKNDVKRKDVFIVADSIHFCGAKSNEAQEKDIENSYDDDPDALD